MVGGEFDLSVGSTAGLSAIVSPDLMAHQNIPVPVSLLIGLAVGALVGVVNGVVVVKFKIPAFIATLGMLFVAQGATQVITDGQPIYPQPVSMSTIAQATLIFGLGWSFLFLIAVVVLGEMFLRVTVPGRNIYAVGATPSWPDWPGSGSSATRWEHSSCPALWPRRRACS